MDQSAVPSHAPRRQALWPWGERRQGTHHGAAPCHRRAARGAQRAAVPRQVRHRRRRRGQQRPPARVREAPRAAALRRRLPVGIWRRGSPRRAAPVRGSARHLLRGAVRRDRGDRRALRHRRLDLPQRRVAIDLGARHPQEQGRANPPARLLRRGAAAKRARSRADGGAARDRRRVSRALRREGDSSRACRAGSSSGSRRSSSRPARSVD